VQRTSVLGTRPRNQQFSWRHPGTEWSRMILASWQSLQLLDIDSWRTVHAAQKRKSRRIHPPRRKGNSRPSNTNLQKASDPQKHTRHDFPGHLYNPQTLLVAQLSVETSSTTPSPNTSKLDWIQTHLLRRIGYFKVIATISTAIALDVTGQQWLCNDQTWFPRLSDDSLSINKSSVGISTLSGFA